ncbi:DUF309 domain-containing protein [Kitasatospora sp. MAP5-34]|uniref:DUF309 domain-containing protein n=1 Tax=Kitasatospora sp. MAP5-34 TaxID=3035102 RepID=UPI002475EC91|nr:DUF309 domain-containing protein [Kitasatospora sp. MAP5-34]MDH6576894.1 hypothetical protein [Kitasatospora sp. MAP5-34]
MGDSEYQGGEPACRLGQVCDECGGHLGDPAPAACERCGAVRGAGTVAGTGTDADAGTGAGQARRPVVRQPGRDRDAAGRARNGRPRDGLGRPLPYGTQGEMRQPEGVQRTPEAALTEAQRLLDAGRPFHAHEVLEDSWKAAPAAERPLWRALAQFAVGLTHAARGNTVGAVALLARAAEGLAAYEQHPPYRINAGGLVRWARQNPAGATTLPPLALPGPDH